LATVRDDAEFSEDTVMNQALDWLKSNIPIVIFMVVIVASVVTLPLLAKGMNDGVREEIQKRARGLSELKRIEDTSVTLPNTGERITGVPNQRLLEQFRRHSEQRLEDSRVVLDASLAHNRKDHTVLMPELFPAPPRDERETLPRRFPGVVREAYLNLLEEVRAGMPPSQAQIAQELDRRERQFRTHILLRDMDAQLNDEEQEQLEDELRSLRMLRYEEQAEMLLYYLDPAILNIPVFDPTATYSLDELFEWQWRFWIHSDVLRALASANEADGSVIRGPVKRVIDLQVGPRTARTGSPQQINPATAIQTDYSVSLTGRRSNHLFDVRTVQLRLIVDSNRIYDVIDAISSYNFMSVLHLDLRSADPYQAARAGFFFGPSPVVELSLQVETIWFREWISERMPESTRQALGIPAPAAGQGT
jgi:hypothetical protein